MAQGKKTKRLSKIAREFNVGISTIVDYLHKKNVKIDSNPNTKIPEDVFDILAKEFSSEIIVKKESENLNFNKTREKKETISIEEEKVSVKVKNTEIYAEEKEEVKVKVVGKINLEEEKKTTTKQPEKEIKKEVKEEPKTITIKEKEEPEKEKKERPPIKAKEEPKKEAEKEPEKEVEKETKKDIKEDVKKELKKPIIPKKEEAVAEDNKIKVIGKIDLSSINQKTRPTKKTKKEREEEKKQKAEAKKQKEADRREKATAETGERSPSTGKSEDRIYQSKIKKLSGPTIVGKIDLPTPKKSSSEKSNEDRINQKKKKRKRIKKDKVNLSAQSNKAKKDIGKKQFKKRRPIIKKEISEEDVQKQIKETLARLTSKSKSKGARHRREKRDAVSHKEQLRSAEVLKQKNILKVTEFVSVNELATMMDTPVNEVIQTCMNLGLFVSINQRLDAETMELVANEFHYKVDFVSADVVNAISEDEAEKDDEKNLIPRPPIVTVMGHVDHGKTSLLDHIRHANVIAGEAGGITQHIGAYNVQLKNGKRITFLDTPGHEAFTAMRARGAQITDIAIIIIAADDNIMPQTIEAINHASAAGVPIVFAINKIDKPGANPEKIKEQLAGMNYLVEDWGGKFQSQDISAKQGKNVEELLEKILLESEMLDLKANPNKKAQGTIIESALDKGKGYVATILIKSGTLKLGDIVLAGSYTGRVKAMYNERGNKIEEAGPSSPALILGLNGAPQAGDTFNIMNTDHEAKEIANKREQLQREQSLRTQKHITLDEIGRRIAIGNFQELNVIIKGDVDGSIEALSDSLVKLSTEEIQINVIHKAVGQISESDVLLATASEAIIIGFQVRPSIGARKLAEKEEIEIRLYSIIYDAINELKDAMEGMLAPEIKEEIVGTAEIRETFRITKVGTIAGCIVKEGKIKRNLKIRIIRDGIVLYSGELGSLKRFKEDVKEVSSGYECGLNIDKFNDLKVADIVEAYEEKEVKRTLK
ncbi:MAG: translation initiation factor IF-2 [Bacteroidetes bacterium]|nr:translation initiation factor IF-2 [Bacteroidota bacterium]